MHSAPADRNGHVADAPHLGDRGTERHPFHLVQESDPLTPEQAQDGLVGLVLGREADSVAQAEADYPAAEEAIRRYGIHESSFPSSTMGKVFTAGLAQRDANGGAHANLYYVRHLLGEMSKAEGADVPYAYGVEVYSHLEAWARGAPPAVHADFYAWVVAQYAYDRDFRGVVSTAQAQLASGTEPLQVGRWMSERLAELGPSPSEPERQATGAADVDEEWFWTCRPELAHIRRAARSRRASPWATLGFTLVQIMGRVHPRYVLGPIETPASLNLYLAAVGESGAGKNRAEKAARAAVDCGPHTPNDGDEPIRMLPVGTGEGIVKNYMKFGVNPANEQVELYQHTVSAITSVSEVDKLAALRGRQGQTVMAVIRDAFTGEAIGNSNSGDEFRVFAEEQTYRFGLVVGVQPGRGLVLLNPDEVAGGTPQRFGWMPVEDPDAPGPGDVPAWPGRLHWEMPAWPDPETFQVSEEEGTALLVIPVCETARRESDADMLSRLRGRKGRGGRKVDPIDAHAMLCRLKWAAALGFLNGHIGVTEEDWALAGVLMAVSNRTRDEITSALRDAAETANHGKGVAEAKRAIVSDQMREEAALTRVCAQILRRAGRADGDGWVTGGGVTQAVTKEMRGHIGPALERLRAEGKIEYEDVTYNGQRGYRIRLRRVHP